jgi:hypothetical protein
MREEWRGATLEEAGRYLEELESLASTTRTDDDLPPIRFPEPEQDDA